MLEKIILNVCNEMATEISGEQVKKLENVLIMSFHGYVIQKESYEVAEVEGESDKDKVNLFYGSKKVSGRQDNTLKQYIREVWKCRNALNKSFNDINTMDIRYYLALQEKNGNSMTTIQNKRRYLNAFWTFLHNEGFVENNPLARIESIKVESVIKKAFSVPDLEALRNACDNPRDRAMMEFLLSTGLRVSELCSLKWGDLDFCKQEFKVMGKGRKERTLYITDMARVYLYPYMKWRLEKEGITFDELMDKPLFAGKKKPFDKMTPAGVQNILKKLGKRAGVENCHPHRMRRTFCSGLLAAGMDIQEVMVLMGHTKLDTTLIYADIKRVNVKNSFFKYANAA